MDKYVNPHVDIMLRHYLAMSNARKILARNVRALMRSTGLDTQTKLAAKAGVGQAHVSRLLNERAGATIDIVEQVAHALHCEAYELLLDDEAARRALIDRLMRGPTVADDHVESHGFVPVDSAGRPKPTKKHKT